MNLELVRRGVIIYTLENASGIYRKLGTVVIRLSVVDYDRMSSDDMTATDLQTEATVDCNIHKPVLSFTESFMK